MNNDIENENPLILNKMSAISLYSSNVETEKKINIFLTTYESIDENTHI